MKTPIGFKVVFAVVGAVGIAFAAAVIVVAVHFLGKVW